MFSRSAPEVPRTVWADETEHRLKDIQGRLRALMNEATNVKSRCNHTLPDGTSTLKLMYDDDGSHSGHICSSCSTYID